MTRLVERTPQGFRKRPISRGHDDACLGLYQHAEWSLARLTRLCRHPSLGPPLPIGLVYRELEYRLPVGDTATFIDVVLVSQLQAQARSIEQQRAYELAHWGELHTDSDTPPIVWPPRHYDVWLIEVKTREESFGALLRQMKLSRSAWPKQESGTDPVYNVRWVLASEMALSEQQQQVLRNDGFFYLFLEPPRMNGRPQ